MGEDGADIAKGFANTLELAEKVRTQQAKGKDKVYALHAPEVECIAKGKARTRYEFGVKTSIALTNARAKGGQFILGMHALPGNPFDGYTLSGQIAQVERIIGIKVTRLCRPRLQGARPQGRGESLHQPHAGHHLADDQARTAPTKRH